MELRLFVVWDSERHCRVCLVEAQSIEHARVVAGEHKLYGDHVEEIVRCGVPDVIWIEHLHEDTVIRRLR